MNIKLSTINKVSLLTNQGIDKALEILKKSLADLLVLQNDRQWMLLLIDSLEIKDNLFFIKKSDSIIIANKRMTISYGKFTLLVDL